MPSWNIHTAHAERLMAFTFLDELGIHDSNVFLFGNYVPDIYAGHMVKPTTCKIEYRETHFAQPLYIPYPNASRFYELYLTKKYEYSDLLLGAWVHLLCDHYYNKRAAKYIYEVGERPSDSVRVRKQHDFDLFGRTLTISCRLQATNELVKSGTSFPQYHIYENDIYAAVRVQNGIIRTNATNHIEGTPEYSLLTPEFFSQTFAEVDAILKEALRMHAAGEDPTCFGRDDCPSDERKGQGRD